MNVSPWSGGVHIFSYGFAVSWPRARWLTGRRRRSQAALRRSGHHCCTRAAPRSRRPPVKRSFIIGRDDSPKSVNIAAAAAATTTTAAAAFDLCPVCRSVPLRARRYHYVGTGWHSSLAVEFRDKKLFYLNSLLRGWKEVNKLYRYLRNFICTFQLPKFLSGFHPSTPLRWPKEAKTDFFDVNIFHTNC